MQPKSPVGGALKPARFRLRWGQREYELPSGDVVLGRGSEAMFSFDDHSISRRHARLLVTEEGVEIEDLDSANGVYVNGGRVEHKQRVVPGDRILIGSQELGIVRRDDSSSETFDRQTLMNLKAAQPIGDTPAVTGRLEQKENTESTSRIEGFALLCAVADKVLSLGRVADAERMLSKHLSDVLDRAAQNEPIEQNAVERATSYAVKLAAATGKGEWIDYVMQLYSRLRRPLPGPTVDQLYTVLRSVSAIDLELLRGYVALMRALSPRFGPAERFSIQRLDGIERLASR